MDKRIGVADSTSESRAFAPDGVPSFGTPVRRREDARLVAGKGRFADDLALPQLLHAAIVRSAYAHALIRSLDVSAARAAPGVVAVLTATEAAEDGLGLIPTPGEFSGPDGTKVQGTPRPLLCSDRVRHLGEPVALVVAESPALAQDAAELVQVEYEALPAVSLAEDAIAPGAPAVWDARPGNVATLWRKGDAEAIAAASRSAAHVTRAEIDVSRVTAAPLEPRTATGSVEDGRLVLRTSTQGPHNLRDSLARTVFKTEPSQIRVIAEDVGGSFGMKSGVYREDVLVLWAARRLGRPVRWASSRAEAFLSDEQARDANIRTELALDADGNFLAFSARCDVNIGAYLTGRSLPLLNNIGGIAGVYRTPLLFAEIRTIFTNTVQTAAYRGAGRPEATYALERTIDIAARELGLDPFELRMRNLIPPEAMPFRTALVFNYDCGDFAGNMTMAADLIDRPGFASRRAAAKARGTLRGLGFANPIEVAGGPFSRPGKDMSRITVDPDGMLTLACGIMSTGQGLETAMTQLVAERLGIPPERIRYRQGDTDSLPFGRGSGGSSSLAVGGAAVSVALDRLIEEARRRAADALEASAGDLVFGAGAFRVAGTDRAVELAALAGGEEGELSAEAEFLPPDVTYPNGCHACEVEVDPETGKVEVVDYAAVEDIGRVLNPLLVDGQMHGGIAQGFGQAVKEAIVHDGNGELITGSFNDYAMPLASDLPYFRLANREVPTAVNPLGSKGVGEAGTVGSLAAIMNAVCDALAELGVRHVDMPATPERVWSAIRAVKQVRPSSAP